MRLDPTLGPAVNEADNLLGAIAGSSALSLTTDWRLQQDSKSRKTICVTVTDPSGSVNAQFAPEELTRPYHLYTRLYQLWGDLLQVRVDRQMQLVNDLLGPPVQEG